MFKKLLGLLILLPTIVFADTFTEGKEYQLISNPEVTENKSKGPIITEFFSYGCPWCFKIDAPLKEWITKTGGAIQLERVPVVFKPDWELYAKAYYTAKILAF